MATSSTVDVPSAPPGAPPSPRADRVRTARPLDARLIVGVLLVLGSVAVGARVLTAADDTVPVLVAVEDLAVDRPLAPALVENRQVRLETGLERYLSGAVPDGYVVVREVRAGELVPRSAVAPAGDREDDLRFVTVSLPAAELPAGLRAGGVADVWVTPVPDAGADATATLLLRSVTVTDVGGDGGGLGVTGAERAVTLAVAAGTGGPGGLDDDVASLVTAARDGRVYLAGIPAGPGPG